MMAILIIVFMSFIFYGLNNTSNLRRNYGLIKLNYRPLYSEFVKNAKKVMGMKTMDSTSEKFKIQVWKSLFSIKFEGAWQDKFAIFANLISKVYKC